MNGCIRASEDQVLHQKMSKVMKHEGKFVDRVLFRDQGQSCIQAFKKEKNCCIVSDDYSYCLRWHSSYLVANSWLRDVCRQL